LKIGVVDGTENPISNLYTQKMFEVQSHLTIEHGYLGYVVIVDKKFWEALPADIRGQLDLAMKDATDYTTDRQATERPGSRIGALGAARPVIHVPTPSPRLSSARSQRFAWWPFAPAKWRRVLGPRISCGRCTAKPRFVWAKF
jgi:C4-dicarboxylate-binding protein DctP